MSSNERDRVLDKIRHLTKLANDGGATEGEVEAAMAGVRRLMTKYGIEEADLLTNDDEEAFGVDMTQDEIVTKAGFAMWEKGLAHAVQDICDVKFLIRTHWDRKKSVLFVGYKRDVAVAKALFGSLLISIKVMARAKFGKGWGTTHRSYCDGFVAGLRARAAEERREAERTTAIVLRKKENVQAFIDQTMNVTPGRSRTITKAIDGRAYRSGHADGQRVATKNTVGNATRGHLS